MFSAVNTIWVLVGAALVFFMQAGFAMVETGLTRAKNAGNIIMKNLMDFCIGTPAFWLLGFGLMFGAGNGIIGSIGGIASEANYGAGMLPDGVPFWAFLIFQTVFCATAATIVSGAMAERTKFSAYCIYSAIISLVIYPISGHWIWGGGWLAKLGFHDFAGSTAVHMVGGVAALVGASILGPRIGKYGKDGKPKAIPGHSLTLAALGVFILWFCWFGFNGASTVSMGDDTMINLAGKVFVNTNLAAAVATVVVMIFTWIRYKKPDVSMSLNGSLAGLVAITAGCDAVTPVGAAVIGIVAGFAVVLIVEFVDKVLKVDDPVGAVAVHGGCGALGTILTGLFADGSTTEAGLFYGGGFHFAGVQLLGVAAVIAYVAIAMFIVFQIIKHTIGLRVSEEEEIDGLDIHEHNLVSSYADFMSGDGTGGKALPTAAEPLANTGAVPDVSHVRTDVMTEEGETPLSKVVIVTRQNKLDKLLSAMNRIGVTGVTITNVLGCGVQKGTNKFYRGAEVEMDLLPKVKVEIIVSTVPVSKVVETAEAVLHTGKYGDGKVFIYNVRNVVKIRTGEEGAAALTDTEAELQKSE